MSEMINATRFLTSISEELAVQSNRVRNLIGSKHWLSDGRHKEALLLALLNRYLPVGMEAMAGFVVNPKLPERISTEQDILIIDTLQEPSLFKQGGLAIVFPANVIAAISVKSNFGRVEIGNSIAGLNSVRTSCSSEQESNAIWCGMFAFAARNPGEENSSSMGTFINKYIVENPIHIPFSNQGIPAVCGPNLFTSASGELVKVGYQEVPNNYDVNHFFSQELATAVFMHELINHAAHRRGLNRSEFSSFVGNCWEASHDMPA